MEDGIEAEVIAMPSVAISGGFDPIHLGHVRMIEEAAAYGDVIVFLNTDEWLLRKKGYAFMPWNERAEILRAIRSVKSVFKACDADGTVCDSLKMIRPDYFANGGDRTMSNTPELRLCADMGIKPLFNVGGAKVQSSSELVRSHAKV